MRIVGVVLVALATLSMNLAPAVAKRKPAAAQPKPAATAAERAAYAAMPETERVAIQSDLIWTGDYNGIAGADFCGRGRQDLPEAQRRKG
jgi:hypothetical protein